MKQTYLLFSILLLSISLANAVSFPSQINISTTYDNTLCQVNVSTEENQHTYNCLQNSSNSFTFNLQRTTDTTITYQNNNSCDLSDLYSISANVNQIATFCNSILASYSDLKTCLRDYTQCSIEKLMLMKADTNRSIVENQSIAYKSQLDTLQISNGILQGNLSSCQKDYLNNKKEGNFYLFIFMIILIVDILICLFFLFYPIEEKKEEVKK